MAHSSGEKPELVLQGVNGDTKEGILLMYFKFEHCCLTEGAVKVQPGTAVLSATWSS